MENNSKTIAAAAFLSLFSLLISCKTPAEKNGTSKENKDKTETAVLSETPENERLYRFHCGTCHQWDGSGVPGMYPDLRNNKIVNGNSENLVKMVLLGITEESRNTEEKFSGEMPPLDYLSDKEISSILTYIRVHFNTNDIPVTMEMVKTVRENLFP